MRFTLMLIFLATVFSVSAQVRPGIKAGSNFAWFKDKGDPKEPRIGLHAGLVAEIPLGKKFFLQLELIYTQKGYKYGSNASVKGKFSRDYIALPLLAGYRLGDYFTVKAGPEIGFLVADKQKLNVTWPYQIKPRSIDLGVDIGAAYFMTKNIGFELRWQQGFYNIEQATITDQYGNELQKITYGKNHLLQLSLMYIFTGRRH